MAADKFVPNKLGQIRILNPPVADDKFVPNKLGMIRLLKRNFDIFATTKNF